MASTQEVLRERVYKFYEENKSKPKKYIVDHFLAENIPSSTIYSIIQRAENEYGYERTPGTGRKAEIMDENGVDRLIEMFDHSDRISQRQAAREFGCSQQYISLTLSTKTTIRARKKQVIPKRTIQQMEDAKRKCGILYRKFYDLSWIIDDESYFTLRHTTINGNNIFYTSNIEQTPANVKFIQKSQYEEKLLVYMIMSEKGVSTPYFIPSGLAVTQEIYLDNCIEKRLIPFINQYHSDGSYVFWPDLASAHYAKSVTRFLNEKNVNFVQKADNPAKVPECRPIEDHWAIVKGLVYKNNWQADNLDQLRNRIRYCIKNMDNTIMQHLSQSVQRRLNDIRRNGVPENR
jgi:hypothetical protein